MKELNIKLPNYKRYEARLWHVHSYVSCLCTIQRLASQCHSFGRISQKTSNPSLLIRTVLEGEFFRKICSAAMYFWCHSHIHTRILIKIGTLTEVMELDQNPKYLQNPSIDGRNKATYFYAAGFWGLLRDITVSLNEWSWEVWELRLAKNLRNDLLDPINCHWSNWAAWGSCSRTCGGGSKTRYRSKNGPYWGGIQCSGSASSSTSCNTHGCPGELLNKRVSPRDQMSKTT